MLNIIVHPAPLRFGYGSPTAAPENIYPEPSKHKSPWMTKWLMNGGLGKRYVNELRLRNGKRNMMLKAKDGNSKKWGWEPWTNPDESNEMENLVDNFEPHLTFSRFYRNKETLGNTVDEDSPVSNNIQKKSSNSAARFGKTDLSVIRMKRGFIGKDGHLYYLIRAAKKLCNEIHNNVYQLSVDCL